MGCTPEKLTVRQQWSELPALPRHALIASLSFLALATLAAALAFAAPLIPGFLDWLVGVAPDGAR